MRSAAKSNRRERAAEARHRRWDAAAARCRDWQAWHWDARAWRDAHDRRHHDYGGASLGKRLLLTFVVASLLSIGVAAGTLQAMLHWNLPSVIEHSLVGQTHWLEARVRFDSIGRPAAMDCPPTGVCTEGVAAEDWKYRVINEHGAVVASSDPGGPPLAPAGQAFDGARASFDVDNGGLRLHVVTMAFRNQGRPYWIQTANSDRLLLLMRGMMLPPMLKNALGIAALALVLFAIGTHATLRRLLWPLHRASAEAERIDPRNLEARLATEFMPRELRPLTAAFNRALDRLEKGYRTQQEFLAAAAHELKTPLALIRGQVELSESEDRAILLADIDRMSRQVQQLLQLAEASEVGNYKFERVDLGCAAQEAIDFLRRLAGRTDILLELRAPEAGVERDADRGAVFALVKNLVENAIQHAPAGAVVTVAVDARGLAVRNPGDPVPQEHLDKLFTRFWRGPTRRDSGAGLGLAICSEIAQAHGWLLEVRNREDGVEFSVAFEPG